jgi:fatty acid desaturase
LIEHGLIVLGVLVLLPHCAAFSFFGWAGIGHELFHNSVFASRGLNRALFKLCSILTWNNPGYFYASHAYHHRHTLEEDDAEGIPHPPISRASLIWLLSIDLPGLYRRLRVLIQNARGIVPQGAAARVLFPEGSRARHELVRFARIILVCQLGSMALFTALQAYWLLLAINLAPFCLTFFNRILAVSQHYGLRSLARGDYPQSCRTVLLHPAVAFFYANMNYHVEHHMYPGVPFYNLPALSELLRARTPFPNIESGYQAVLRTLTAQGLLITRQPTRMTAKR